MRSSKRERLPWTFPHSHNGRLNLYLILYYCTRPMLIFFAFIQVFLSTSFFFGFVVFLKWSRTVSCSEAASRWAPFVFQMSSCTSPDSRSSMYVMLFYFAFHSSNLSLWHRMATRFHNEKVQCVGFCRNVSTFYSRGDCFFFLFRPNRSALSGLRRSKKSNLRQLILVRSILWRCAVRVHRGGKKRSDSWARDVMCEMCAL